MNWFGLGVTDIDGEVYCVPNSKVGDELWVEPTEDRFAKKIARPILSKNPTLQQTLQTSPCPYLLSCPGCVLLERSTAEQQQIQEDTHLGAMSRILEEPIEKLSASVHWEAIDWHIAYRSKLSAKVKLQLEPQIQIDFVLQDRWGEMDIPLKNCVVQNQESRHVLQFLSQSFQERLQGLSDISNPVEDSNDMTAYSRLIFELNQVKTLVVYALQNQVSIIIIHREQLEKPQESFLMQVLQEFSCDHQSLQKIFSHDQLPSMSVYTQLSSSLQPKKSFPLVHCFGQSALVYQDPQPHAILGKQQQFQYTPPSWISQNPSSIQTLRQIILRELQAISKTLDQSLDQMSLVEFGCGVGITTLWLAPYVKSILGVEIMHCAYLDALHNAMINEIENVRFRCADAKKIMTKLVKEGFDHQVAIIHAMRSELHPLLLALGQAKVDTVIYLAPCAPSLARDVKASQDEGIGWDFQKRLMLDQMPGTATAMTIAILKRRSMTT
jgi:tRNA/tmRNA/rRNA uracil-C5-methylase (TrmA/RlmC/RlmD family)